MGCTESQEIITTSKMTAVPMEQQGFPQGMGQMQGDPMQMQMAYQQQQQMAYQQQQMMPQATYVPAQQQMPVATFVPAQQPVIQMDLNFQHQQQQQVVVQQPVVQQQVVQQPAPQAPQQVPPQAPPQAAPQAPPQAAPAAAHSGDQNKKFVEVGPIWDNNHAQEKAKEWLAHNPGWKFTGEWKTTIPNEMSVIEVELITKKFVDVGPIWDNNHAQEKAREWVAANHGWKFTGEWKTTIPNEMSAIEVALIVKKFIEVGPIWDNNDAQAKAQNWVAQNPGWKFTGQWKTTIPNEMSVIEISNE